MRGRTHTSWRVARSVVWIAAVLAFATPVAAGEPFLNVERNLGGIGNLKALDVGDIVTILIIENASGNAQAKTDTNNKGAISTDAIGLNAGYATGTREERAAIEAAHRCYQQGLLWTLANHPRVPAPIRAEMSRWGLPADEFTETGGWPPQLYIREARRITDEPGQSVCNAGIAAPPGSGESPSIAAQDRY